MEAETGWFAANKAETTNDRRARNEVFMGGFLQTVNSKRRSDPPEFPNYLSVI
jgi:hypothetical protein